MERKIERKMERFRSTMNLLIGLCDNVKYDSYCMPIIPKYVQYSIQLDILNCGFVRFHSFSFDSRDSREI